MACAVSYDDHRHLSDLDDAVLFDARVDSKICDMEQTREYQPFSDDSNVQEALESVSAECIKALREKLAAGDLAGAGEALKKFVSEYWQQRIFEDASEQVAAERCSSCRGRGCRLCEPVDF